MVLDISSEQFKSIFDDEQFSLPVRWEGADFSKTLGTLLDNYIDKLRCCLPSNDFVDVISKVCDKLIEAVNKYLNGFPYKAYYAFKTAMNLLEERPLKVDAEYVLLQDNKRQKRLFRMVGVDDNKPYLRSRVFHTPFDLRSKVSTSRYSIAGHPSLYLSTSLELCCKEIHYNPYKQFALAAGFELERSMHTIRVIELGLKPHDFINPNRDEENEHRYIIKPFFNSGEVRLSYLLWYPLIAACSFIRINKADPFAAEYVLPQLLMQWVRIQMESKYKDDQLVGIRYFSCASKRASEMGFNYVFPSSEQNIQSQKYCDVLSKSFRVTEPVYIHDYEDVLSCERDLIRSNNIDFI